MKKFKEFLCLLIPFTILSILSIVFFVIQINNADVIGYMSGAEYLKLMLKDPTFVIALVNSYVPPVIITLIPCAVYKVIAFALRKSINITRKPDYIILFAIGFIIPVIYIIAFTKKFDFTNNLVFALQVSLIVTFIFWLVELIISKIKRKDNSLKKFSIITIIIGALMLIVGVAPLLLSFLVVPNTPSVGIIGGADFSATLRITYIFWTGSFYHHLAFWGVVLLIISNFRKKD